MYTLYTMYIVQCIHCTLCTDCTLCTLCIDSGTGLVWYVEQMVVYRITAQGGGQEVQEQEQENRGKYDRVKKSLHCLWTVLVVKCICIFPGQAVLFLQSCALCHLTPEHIKALNTFFN